MRLQACAVLHIAPLYAVTADKVGTTTSEASYSNKGLTAFSPLSHLKVLTKGIKALQDVSLLMLSAVQNVDENTK